MSSSGPKPPRSRLDGIARALAAGWSRETCDPVDRDDWSPANPARGQCGATALVVQDLMGGELLVAEVRHADGSRQGLHYWNRLPGAVELDLTRAQFQGGETLGAPRVVKRPTDLRGARVAAQYRRLSDRVNSIRAERRSAP